MRLRALDGWESGEVGEGSAIERDFFRDFPWSLPIVLKR